MSANFEEARSATEELFGGTQLPDAAAEDGQQAPAEATQAQEAPTQEQPVTAEEQMLAEATQTAEEAANVANEKDAQLQQALAELEAARRQNMTLQGTVEELSRRNEEKLVEEAMEIPVLDVGAIAFADEETAKNAQAEYTRQMLEYSRQQIMKEMQPFVDHAKEGIFQKEKNEAISVLSNLPELSGIDSMLPQLDAIIDANKAMFDNIPVDQRYITAYAIAKGVDAIYTPQEEKKEMSVDEMMALYNSNPAFREMVEKQRLEQIKDSQQVPPFSASSGAVNAALNIKEKPKTFEEASRRTREMFGL